MKNWKISSNVKKVHEDLYTSVNSEEECSETYLSSIVKKVFVSKDEQTRKNAVWTQSILEIIFDKGYLSSKIETECIDKWYARLIKVVLILFYCFLLFLLFLLFSIIFY